MKWITILISVTGLVLIIYSGFIYLQSGELAYTIPLKKIGHSTGQVELAPNMSPVRIILNIQFISRTKSETVRFYSYAVGMADEQKNTLLSKKGALTLRRDSRDIPANELFRTQQRIHSLAVFSIGGKGIYDWDVQLANHQAEISRADLEIRHNVETGLPRTLWLGLGLLLGGILSLFFITGKVTET